jgi:uncharacterized protein (TIGR02246 family)
MNADQQTGAAVMAVLNRFCEAYVTRDVDRLLSLFAADDDVLVIGTGQDERRVGRPAIRAQVERDWAQSDACRFHWTWHSVSAAGPVAWLAAEGDIDAQVGEQHATLPVRLTCVLEKRAGEWLFVQFHTSAPASGQARGESFPTAASSMAHASSIG